MTDIPPTYWYLSNTKSYVMDDIGNVYRVKALGLVRCNPKFTSIGTPTWRLWIDKSYKCFSGFQKILKLRGEIYSGSTELNPPQPYKKEKVIVERKYTDLDDIAEQSYIDRFRDAHTVLNALLYAGGRIPDSMWFEVIR